jgi:hypothetical protein
MNNRIRKQDLEKLLYFDCETVRRNEVLDINSKEYELYAQLEHEIGTHLLRSRNGRKTKWNILHR